MHNPAQLKRTHTRRHCNGSGSVVKLGNSTHAPSPPNVFGMCELGVAGQSAHVLASEVAGEVHRVRQCALQPRDHQSAPVGRRRRRRAARGLRGRRRARRARMLAGGVVQRDVYKVGRAGRKARLAFRCACSLRVEQREDASEELRRQHGEACRGCRV